MGAEPDYRALAREIKSASEALSARDGKVTAKVAELEHSVNELLARAQRPGSDYRGGEDLERKSAIEMCEWRHGWERQKSEGREIDYVPSSLEIDEAITAQRAWHKIIRHGRLERLSHEDQKSSSSFTFGGSGWVIPPELSRRILTCLTDQADFMSLLSRESISGSSIQFPLDNSELIGGGWACEVDCGGPPATIPAPGMIEIKPESLRAPICTPRDLLEDASFNVEGWIREKAERWYRQQLATAFICGDGNGRPMGILNPRSGIPVCNCAPSTTPGEFAWQDLFQLKAQLPEEYQQRGIFLMNAQTLSLVLTMTDAVG
jgi:HK97 family phage major capsid protein